MLATSSLAVVVTAATVLAGVPAPLTTPAGAAGATLAEARFPPSSQRDLAEIFDRRLAPLGLRVTRAALQDPDRGYRLDPRGTHLAIYAEPTEAFSDARYVETIVSSARVFLPRVFKRWKGIETFDICLEPEPAHDTSESPPPNTQIWVTRPGVGGVRWRTVSLAQLLGAARAAAAAAGAGDRGDVYVYVASHLQDDPGYQAASEDADDVAADDGANPASPGRY